jgi:hypothetical protein
VPSYKKSEQDGDILLYGGGAGGVAAWQGGGGGVRQRKLRQLINTYTVC